MAPTTNDYADRGAKLFHKLSSFYSSQEEAVPAPPSISERTAILISVLFTILYVAPFYLSPTLRTTPLNSRDAPSVIQARVRAVIVTCIACSVIAGFVLVEYGHCSPWDILRLTGIWPAYAIDSAQVLALSAILFVGPLYESLIVDGDWQHINVGTVKETLWTSHVTYRNLIVAPLSEELVFRSLIIAVYLVAQVEPTRIVLISPLIFGLAHIHHFVEYCAAHTLPGRLLPTTQILVRGTIRSIFQFTYTSLFGFFAAFVFLRTGSVWAAIVAHIFCNWMGFPRIWGRLSSKENSMHAVTPDVAQGKRDDSGNGVVKVGTAAMINDEKPSTGKSMTIKQTSIIVSIIYYGLLVLGAYAFYKLLWRLTASQNELAGFA